MKKERAKVDSELLLRIRVSDKLVKWLIGLVASGGAVTAAMHYL